MKRKEKEKKEKKKKKKKIPCSSKLNIYVCGPSHKMWLQETFCFYRFEVKSLAIRPKKMQFYSNRDYESGVCWKKVRVSAELRGTLYVQQL